MAFVVQADPSLAGFNCFCTLLEANAYHDARLHNTDWTAALDVTKNSALAWATNQLNNLTWLGVRSSGTQLLSFPRKGLSYTESYDISGQGYYTTIPVTSTEVPQDIKNATAELALWLIGSDTTAPTGLVGFKRLKVDSIEIEVQKGEVPPWFDRSIRDLCKKFLANNTSYSVNTMRVG